MEIQIEQAILHVLDTNIDMPVLSDVLLELSEDVKNFIITRIDKFLSGDDYKCCSFEENSEFSSLIQSGSDNFVAVTQQLARRLFDIMKRNPDILSADVMFAIAVIDGNTYLFLDKMNYRETYIHHFENTDGLKNNSIIRQRTVLPSPKSKIDEAALVNLEDGSIKLIERKFEIDGSKDFYLSACYLQCSNSISAKQKLAVITDTVKSINQKYYENDKDVQNHVASVLYNEVSENKETTIEDLCDNFYGDSASVKQEFIQELKTKNVDVRDTLKVSPGIVRKLEKQSIKTSSGIEIKIPIELYENEDSVEFINNPDGTISILVKNIML